MNDFKNKNEIILDEININNNQDNNVIDNKDNIENEENNNLFETDLLKYNFDYATKFNSINYLSLDQIKKKKFLLLIFLMSSKLNFFNKIISLDRLYSIFDLEKNENMIKYIILKLLKYIKDRRTSINMVNTSSFFCNGILSNNINYYFVYNVLKELKKINKNVSLAQDVIKEINQIITVKITCFENLFRNLKNDESIYNIYKFIKYLLNPSKNQEKKEIIKEEEKENGKDGYLYIISRIWLENANLFLYNYVFSKKSKTLPDFFEDAFSIDNVISVFLSPKKIEAPVKDKNYYPFPGPINNLFLTDYKNVLFDPQNLDENFLIKKNLKEYKDYFWIQNKDWTLIKNNFDATNEIKRKRNELEMVRISAIIFDYRMRKYKNESIDFMQKKVIQICKNRSIKDLENKILRCMNYQINNLKIKYKTINQNEENEDKAIYLYKVNTINRDVIIEMFLSFVNKIKTYESVFFQEIILSEEDKTKNVSEIFNKFDEKNEILIIEINTINKENPKFLLPINTKELSCSICLKPIKDLNDTKYMCELCSMYLFCSKECAQISDKKNNNPKILEHFKLHKFLSDIITKPFDLEELINSNIKEENKSKNKGEVGLYNLGNTCYMNCSIQCLSHTSELTKYFINNYFQNEINLESKFGSKGVLLKSYSDLINLMWFSERKIINPSFLRIAFIESTNKFGNNMQQDAMEFISILLNYLHEDLNRIREKPYIQMDSQKETETDIQASERFYNYHLQRENSIIIDLFHGQFQNIIKCIECLKENKTYEPFSNITLPIPEEHNFYIIKFFTQLKCKYITININSETTFGELIKKATKFLSKKILDALEEIKKENKMSQKYIKTLMEKNIEIVKLDKEKIINVIYSEPEDEKDIQVNYQKKLIKYINQEEEIILFEREIIPEYHQNIYIYPVTFDEKDEPEPKINFLSYPVVFPVKHDLTLENLEKMIKEKFRHILLKDTNINNAKHIIDLYILHWKRNKNTGIMKIIKDYPKCRFCGNDYSQQKFCPLYYYFNKKDTIANIFKVSKYSEPFVLLARSSYFDVKKEVYPGYYFEENNNLNKHKNIYDSLNQFGKYECLGKDNLWDCPQCKTRRKIYKAIKIFQAPKYLIIQLKRFKKKSEGFFNFLEGDKNETFVSFPTKNLDLNNYIVGPSKSNSIYNLYAVINHKNVFGCNHFTSFCLSNNRWIEFDDHNIFYKVNTPVTSDAYILFYIKKS